MVVLDQGFNGDRASQVAVVVKNTAANAGEWLASYPGKAQSSGETTLDKHITVQQVLG